MTRKALVEFHYASDGVNPIRYRAGADVPVKPEHVDKLIAEGKLAAGMNLLRMPGNSMMVASPIDIADEERAELPALDPNASNDPADFIVAEPARTRRKRK